MKRVVKIGGSLLTRPRLADDLLAWAMTQSPATNVVILGGGQLIDAIRAWDALRPADPTQTHWRCVELLAMSHWHWMQTLGGDPRFLASKTIVTPENWLAFQTSQRETHRWVWLNVPAAYFPGCLAPLPEDWRTTTDAIAWWLACEIAAEECVLLKSCEVARSLDVAWLVEAGIIDAACGQLDACGVPLRVQRLPTT